MINATANSVNAINPGHWQNLTLPWTEWLAAIAIVTLTIWFTLTVICIIVERRDIRRSMINRRFLRPQPPL